jgi:hypothetical protein
METDTIVLLPADAGGSRIGRPGTTALQVRGVPVRPGPQTHKPVSITGLNREMTQTSGGRLMMTATIPLTLHLPEFYFKDRKEVLIQSAKKLSTTQ